MLWTQYHAVDSISCCGLNIMLWTQYHAVDSISCCGLNIMLWTQYHAVDSISCCGLNIMLWTQYHAVDSISCCGLNIMLWTQYHAVDSISCCGLNIMLWTQYHAVDSGRPLGKMQAECWDSLPSCLNSQDGSYRVCAPIAMYRYRLTKLNKWCLQVDLKVLATILHPLLSLSPLSTKDWIVSSPNSCYVHQVISQTTLTKTVSWETRPFQNFSLPSLAYSYKSYVQTIFINLHEG